MTKNLRTVHSSYVDLDPTEYVFAGAFDDRPERGSYLVAPGAPGPWHVYDDSKPDADLTWPGTNPLNAQDSYFWHVLKTSPTSRYSDEGARCDHCGAWLRYVVVLFHTPTGTYCQVGETCFTERFGHNDKVSKEVDRLRKRAAAARVSKKQQAAVEAWFAADPRNRFAVEYAEAHRDENGFYDDLLRKLKKWGPWSDRQRDAVLRGVVTDKERAKAKAERDAEVKAPLPDFTGRVTVEGVVVSVKWQENDFGSRQVMTVKHDDGWLVWGSVPSGLYDVERGDRVRFDATVEKSDRDESFGFFKRPTKATVLDDAAVAA